MTVVIHRRMVLLIPVVHRIAANQLAAAFDSDAGGIRTFDFCALSATGLEPATHEAAEVPIHPSRLAMLENIKASGSVPAELRADLTQEVADAALVALQLFPDQMLSDVADAAGLQLIRAEA